jgi:hypothetical protein
MPLIALPRLSNRLRVVPLPPVSVPKGKGVVPRETDRDLDASLTLTRLTFPDDLRRLLLVRWECVSGH